MTEHVTEIFADFGKPRENNLVKNKFGFFNSAYVPVERFVRDAGKLAALRPASLRYEIGWGMGDTPTVLHGNQASPQEYDAPAIVGSPSEPMLRSTADIDAFVDALNERNIEPFLICCYSPIIFQPPAGNYTSCPVNLQGWRLLCQQYAEHFAASGRRVGYYELWNEPDLDVFWTGTADAFFEVYRHGALGIRAGDPFAQLGGPALSLNIEWATQFLQFVKAHSLPLDFLSFHMFGNRQDHFLQEYRTLLQSDPYFTNTRLVLSEYHPFSAQTHGSDFCAGGLVEQPGFAPIALSALRKFLDCLDLVMVNWAQFNDPEVFGPTADRCGVVDVDGKCKAAYYAFWLYAQMPEARFSLDGETDSVEGFASCDEHRVSLLLWNRSQTPQKILLHWKNMPFTPQKATLHRIDDNHPDDAGHLHALSATGLNLNKAEWVASLPAAGTVYLSLSDEP